MSLKYPGAWVSESAYTDELAHQIIAGADIFSCLPVMNPAGWTKCIACATAPFPCPGHGRARRDRAGIDPATGAGTGFVHRLYSGDFWSHCNGPWGCINDLGLGKTLMKAIWPWIIPRAKPSARIVDVYRSAENASALSAGEDSIAGTFGVLDRDGQGLTFYVASRTARRHGSPSGPRPDHRGPRAYFGLDEPETLLLNVSSQASAHLRLEFPLGRGLVVETTGPARLPWFIADARDVARRCCPGKTAPGLPNPGRLPVADDHFFSVDPGRPAEHAFTPARAPATPVGLPDAGFRFRHHIQSRKQ